MKLLGIRKVFKKDHPKYGANSLGEMYGVGP